MLHCIVVLYFTLALFTIASYYGHSCLMIQASKNHFYMIAISTQAEEEGPLLVIKN